MKVSPRPRPRPLTNALPISAFVALALGSTAMHAPPALAASEPPPTLSPAPDVYAVIVGYNGGAPGLPSLRFADDDAVRFAMLLGTPNGSAATTHVELLTDVDAESAAQWAKAGFAPKPTGSASRTSVTKAFENTARLLRARPRQGPPPVFYFIYAGHGVHGHILLAPEAGAEAALTGHELRALVATLPSAAPELRAYAFVDACRAQSLFSERGAATEPGVGPDLAAETADLEERARSVPLGVIAAAVSDRPAGEMRSLGGGFFSHVLASGLAGAADADGNNIVSFAELAAFVAYNTQHVVPQRPWFSPPAGDLSATVVDLRGARTRVDLSAAPSGRYLIAGREGRPLLAEAFKSDGHDLRLVMPPGRFRITQVIHDQPLRTTDIELEIDVPQGHAAAGIGAWSEQLAASATALRGTSDADEPTATDAPAFLSAFTSDAVATLAAAYHAGREPEQRTNDASASQALGVALNIATAPAGLTGVETGVAAHYRRRMHRLFWGVEALLARSPHTVASATYSLERYAGLVELGVPWRWRKQSLALSVGLGGGLLVRRAYDGGLSGDTFAPTALTRALYAVQLSERFALAIAVEGGAEWIAIDGRRSAFGRIAGNGGIEWTF